MTNRDRLIELIVNADTYDSYECKLCTKKDTSCIHCNAEKLADYLLANGVVVLDTNVVYKENRPLIKTVADMPLNDVVELVKAKQEGRIIVPPCKVGDTVYVVSQGQGLCMRWNVYEGKVVDIHLNRHNKLTIRVENGEKFFGYYEPCFIFLTKEEAEEKLKELKENVDL